MFNFLRSRFVSFKHAVTTVVCPIHSPQVVTKSQSSRPDWLPEPSLDPLLTDDEKVRYNLDANQRSSIVNAVYEARVKGISNEDIGYLVRDMQDHYCKENKKTRSTRVV